jgi:enoyl-CoA hydratase/carnithine racemase
LIYSEALVILSPLTKSDWRIAAIAEAHFNQFLVDLGILPDVKYKANLERKAGKFFKFETY